MCPYIICIQYNCLVVFSYVLIEVISFYMFSELLEKADDDQDISTKDLIRSATIASQWPQLNYGKHLQNSKFCKLLTVGLWFPPETDISSSW